MSGVNLHQSLTIQTVEVNNIDYVIIRAPVKGRGALGSEWTWCVGRRKNGQAEMRDFDKSQNVMGKWHGSEHLQKGRSCGLLPLCRLIPTKSGSSEDNYWVFSYIVWTHGWVCHISGEEMVPGCTVGIQSIEVLPVLQTSQCQISEDIFRGFVLSRPQQVIDVLAEGYLHNVRQIMLT